MQAISMLERGVRATPRSTTVELLAKALQLEPAQRTALEAAANADRRLVPPPERTTAGLHIPTGLQPPPTPFVGRAREQAALRALLAAPAVRLVTLTGPPGSGKTRLALEVAAELATAYGDGVWAVAGGPLREPNLLMPAIGQGLGLDKTGRKPTLDTVAAHCRARHLLLVLDNLEQLLAATPELLELLASCPRIQILVTSRVRLRARQERELPVPPLDDAAAMALFAERAAAADPGFEVDDRNAAAVAAICRRLDGLPLALELAAPWVRLLSPEQFLPRLDRRLDLLVHGSVDLPDRHRTLRAALAWSCELLAPGPLALLRRLSVFVGGAPLDGVQRVWPTTTSCSGSRPATASRRSRCWRACWSTGGSSCSRPERWRRRRPATSSTTRRWPHGVATRSGPAARNRGSGGCGASTTTFARRWPGRWSAVRWTRACAWPGRCGRSGTTTDTGGRVVTGSSACWRSAAR
ncbi:MAG: hypothetical protein E6J41_32645 [Chloroflexi bacterium]|nr:MAG: hypothetical protein E6J41_32645 [Chloroflexota bacterium]